MKSKAFEHRHYPDWIDPALTTEYPKNAKIHTPEQVQLIADNIQKYGWQQDTVLSADNVVVIGHGRRLAALLIGCDMPYHRVGKNADELTEEDIRALRIADNKLNESPWDVSALDEELGYLQGVGIDIEELGFDVSEDAEWFTSGDTGEAEEGEEEYQEFLEKFEAKHTSDDCYTPAKVYDAVADFVEKEYGVSRRRFVRPFYPGGDYQKQIYKPTDVVVDNPPFSILSEILQWYNEHGVRYFLFAPSLTLFSSAAASACSICVGVSIEYENKATISTSFVTNMEDGVRCRTAPALYKAVDAAVKEIRAENRTELPKYTYPDEIVTSTMLARYSKYGVDYRVSRDESVPIDALDAQKAAGKAIFGKGFLVSTKAAAEKAAAEKAAAEKAAAEKAAAEKAAATRWQLSDREREIVNRLGESLEE